MKALGYNSSSIMLKYVLYSLIASVGGSVLGNIIGLTVFPSIIYNAYTSTTYTLPSVNLFFIFLHPFITKSFHRKLLLFFPHVERGDTESQPTLQNPTITAGMHYVQELTALRKSKNGSRQIFVGFPITGNYTSDPRKYFFKIKTIQLLHGETFRR